MKRSVLFLIIVWIFVVMSFLTTQLTFDFIVFWAYARQVNDSPFSGIAALVDIWELKGLLFKTIIFADYKITTLFSNDYSLYCQFIYKFFGLFTFLSLLALTIRIVPNKYLIGVNRWIFFLISSVLLLTVHFSSHLQAEMWAVLFLLFAFSLYLHDKVWYKVIAAIILSLTFFLKSPIPLLGGSLLFGVMLVKKQTIKESIRDAWPFALTFAVFLCTSLSLIEVFFPQEIIDIWDASYYQHTLFHDGGYKGAIISLLSGLVVDGIIYNLPCSLGLLFAFLLIYKWWKEKKLRQCILLVLVWIFPLIYITISNRFFAYHYYLIVFPSLITLYLFYKERQKYTVGKIVYSIVVGAYLCFYVVGLSSIAPSNLLHKSHYTEQWKVNKETQNIYIGCKLDSKDVLFLDGGQGAFVFNNKSYLRYFYPLPLQRVSDDDPFTQTDTYKKVKSKVLAYHGEYLTLAEEWFFMNGNEDIKNKILQEYEIYKVIRFPQFPWTLFSSEKSTFALSLYKRKSELSSN